MKNGVSKMLQIPGAALLPHLEGIEDMDLRRALQMVRQRGDKVGVELLFAALEADIQPDVLPGRQQPHKTAAQTAPVGRPDVSAAFRFDIPLDLKRFFLFSSATLKKGRRAACPFCGSEFLYAML